MGYHFEVESREENDDVKKDMCVGFEGKMGLSYIMYGCKSSANC